MSPYKSEEMAILNENNIFTRFKSVVLDAQPR